MDPALLERLFSRAVLLPTGVCLIVVGFVMRGLVSSSRREQALRKQRDLLDGPASDSDAIDRHLEKYMPRYATATIWLGVILALTGLFR